MTAPTNIKFFADFQGIAALKNDAKAQAPTALKEAARQFESLFTQMLLKSMREANKSFGGDSLFGSDQADMYQDMFDDQIAMQMSKGKGLGLADMLVRQLQGGVPSAEPTSSEPRREAGPDCRFERRIPPQAPPARRAGRPRDRRRSRRSCSRRPRSKPVGAAPCRATRRASAASTCSASRPAASGRARPSTCRRWSSNPASRCARSSAFAPTTRRPTASAITPR